MCRADARRETWTILRDPSRCSPSLRRCSYPLLIARAFVYSRPPRAFLSVSLVRQIAETNARVSIRERSFYLRKQINARRSREPLINGEIIRRSPITPRATNR